MTDDEIVPDLAPRSAAGDLEGRRVWAVYEPLTFHRTAAMLGRFAEVLAGADAVAIEIGRAHV